MLKFLYDLNKACEMDERSKKKNIRAFEKTAAANKKLQDYEEKGHMALKKLSNRKKGILSTSLTEFVELFERIIKIEFTESDGIRELSDSRLVKFTESSSVILSNAPKLILNNSETAAVMIKGFFSGSAFGALVVKDSEINSRMASMRMRESELVESQTETVCLALDAIIIRAEKIAEILTKLNILFRKSCQNANTIIDKNGIQRQNYSEYDKKCIMNCINLAGALKSIIDTKLLDEDGSLASQSLEVIEIGNEYLNKLSDIIKKE